MSSFFHHSDIWYHYMQVALSDGGSDEWINTDGVTWDEFPVDNICSRKVRVQALSVHNRISNGFLEIEVHADSEYILRVRSGNLYKSKHSKGDVIVVVFKLSFISGKVAYHIKVTNAPYSKTR